MAIKPLTEMLRGVTRFGRLTVLAEAEPYRWRNRSYRMALCRCDCGAVKSVAPSKLVHGVIVSCGCHAAELARISHTTHGMTGSPEYVSWSSMKHRCCNPNDPCFDLYGGRGITVCERWMDSFEAFYADMGQRPEGMTLDRIEVDRGYEPSNCRWATPIEQADNTRVARKLLVGKERINLSEASRRSGLDRGALRRRMKRGLGIEQAMALPPDRTCGSRRKSNNRKVIYQGLEMLLCEVEERTGVTSSHISYHTKRGRSVDEAVALVLEKRAADKSKCGNGHPMSEDNVYTSPKGSRQCRTCRAEAQERARAKARAT